MCSGRGAPCSYPGSASSRLCCCCYWLLLDSLARSLWLTLLLQTSRPTRRTSTSHSITIATAMRRLMVVVMWRRRSSSCSASARPRKPRCGARRRAARLPRSRSLPTVVRANQRTNSTCSTSLCFACTRLVGLSRFGDRSLLAAGRFLLALERCSAPAPSARASPP